MDIKTGFLEANGTRLYYETAGEGATAVVLICGGGMLDNRMWDGQVGPFAESYRVVRYDLRGLGKSEVPDERFSHLEDLRALLEHLGIGRAALAGLSLGSSIAIDYTLEHPSMVEALILASPGVGGYEFSEEYMRGLTELFTIAKTEGAGRAIELMMSDDSYAPSESRADSREKVRRILSNNKHVFRDFAFATLAEQLAPPAIKRLAEVDVPALVITGDRDQPEHLAIAELLTTNLPRAEKASVTDSGHLVNIERPEEFNRRSLEFLSRL
jgi:pimeloyl-ACP methyl ester carboxylesterase